MDQREVLPANGKPFVIAGWHVDPSTLRISKADESQKLEPKAMAVLVYLAENAGSVVSRQDLEDNVWAGTVVGYDAISNAVIKLRKAFGDDAHDPQIIETIPKTGYRLIASLDSVAPDAGADKGNGQEEQASADEVDPIDAPQTSAWNVKSAAKIFLPVALLIVVALLWFKPAEPTVEPASTERMKHPLPDKPSIAVMPFTNLSDDPQQDFFAHGMTDDLITDISKVSGLFVVSRNSVDKYKDHAADIREVAEDLGVRYVMQGSVRRVGNDVRINAQLIDALSGGHEWAERYDGSMDDVFSMQDQIVASIVDELEIVLVGGEKVAIVETKTANTDAYDAYLRGWERYRQGTPEDLAKAKFFFEQAIDLDPNYSQAHSAIAAVDWSININGWARTIGLYPFQARNRSRKSLDKAMENPSALAYQVSAESSTLFYRKPDKALREAELAIAANANDPAGHLAMAAALLKAGKPDEAEVSVRTAMRHDPEYPAYYLNRLAQAQYQMRAFQDAVETLEISAKRNPGDDWTFVYLVAAYGQLGNREKAQEALETANALRAKVGWGPLEIQHGMGSEEDSWKTAYLFKWYGDLKAVRDGLRKAGVPFGNEWRNLVTYTGTDVTIQGANVIDDQTAKELHERGIPFVDIYFLWSEKRIPGAHFLEKYTYDFNEVLLSKIANKNQEVVLYSSRGGDESDVIVSSVALAQIWGYEKAYYYRHGLKSWEKSGYPMDYEKINVLN